MNGPCPNCGHLNLQGSTFCERCGVNLMTYTPIAPLPPYKPPQNKRKKMITIGVVAALIIVLIIVIAAVMLPGTDQWPEDGTYDLGANELSVRGADLSSEWQETSFVPGLSYALIGLDGPDGSHLTVTVRIYDSADSASDAYESTRQDYYSMGGSDDLGIGNRSCYIRMVFTDTGTDAYILAAFQKANVVVDFDFVPGYDDLSLSDLKDVAWEQYDKIQN